MILSHRCGSILSILILFHVLVFDKSDAISFAKGASRPRQAETSSAAQLYYRNGLHPEDEIVTVVSSISHVVGVAPTETPKSLIPAQIAQSGPGSSENVYDVDMETIVSILYSQLCALLLSTIGFGVLALAISSNGSVYADHLFWKSVADALTPEHWNPINLLHGIGGAMPLIFLHHCGMNAASAFSNDHKESNNPAGTLLYGNQMEMTHMTIKLFGRRRHNFSTNQQKSRTAFRRAHMASTPTATCLALSVVITGLFALSSEMMYRLYLPLLCGFVTDSSLALLIPALLYGVSHSYWTHSPTHSIPTIQRTVLHQTLVSLWYSFLLSSSGSLIFPIMAHFLYDMDILTTTWHTINDQMDYVDQKLQRCEKEITKAAVPQLTTEAAQVSHRIFHAFDSQHAGSLNEADVHYMVQYMYYNKQQMRPSPVIISEEFHRFARGENHASNEIPPRLDYEAFLEFLNKLQRYEKLHTTVESHM
jgi:membrane protease YdiL (CAAX protease family)